MQEKVRGIGLSSVFTSNCSKSPMTSYKAMGHFFAIVPLSIYLQRSSLRDVRLRHQYENIKKWVSTAVGPPGGCSSQAM